VVRIVEGSDVCDATAVLCAEDRSQFDRVLDERQHERQIAEMTIGAAASSIAGGGDGFDYERARQIGKEDSALAIGDPGPERLSA
jgi:hypothetical protein